MAASLKREIAGADDARAGAVLGDYRHGSLVSREGTRFRGLSASESPGPGRAGRSTAAGVPCGCVGLVARSTGRYPCSYTTPKVDGGGVSVVASEKGFTMTTATNFADQAETALRAAKAFRAAGNHSDAATSASLARQSARLALAAANTKSTADMNAVQRAEKAASEAQDVTGWTPPGMASRSAPSRRFVVLEVKELMEKHHRDHMARPRPATSPW